MEPLSITAGTIGITTFAITSIRSLHDLIESLTEAKEVVQDISTSLKDTLGVVNALQELQLPDANILAAAKRDLERAGVGDAVERCGTVCNAFKGKLEKWTKHSSPQKWSLRDRLTVGLWNKERIQTLRISVQSCQSTVQFAVQTTQLHIQLRSEQVSDTDRANTKQQLQILETKIETHLELTKKLISKVSERKLQLQGAMDDEDDDDVERTLSEVDKQSHMLEQEQVSTGIFHSQVHARVTGQEIGDVLTEGGSSALVGLPKSVVGKINQRIGNVTTSGNSSATIGVFPDNVEVGRSR